MLQREVKGAKIHIATNESSAQENENDDEEGKTTSIAKLIANPIHDSKSNPMKMAHVCNKQSEFSLINSLAEIVFNCRPIHLKMLSNYLSTTSAETEGVLRLCKKKSAWSANYAEQTHSTLSKLLRDNSIKDFDHQLSFSLGHARQGIGDDQSSSNGCRLAEFSKDDNSVFFNARMRSSRELDSKSADGISIAANGAIDVDHFNPSRGILIVKFNGKSSISA